MAGPSSFHRASGGASLPTVGRAAATRHRLRRNAGADAAARADRARVVVTAAKGACRRPELPTATPTASQRNAGEGFFMQMRSLSCHHANAHAARAWKRPLSVGLAETPVSDATTLTCVGPLRGLAENGEPWALPGGVEWSPGAVTMPAPRGQASAARPHLFGHLQPVRTRWRRQSLWRGRRARQRRRARPVRAAVRPPRPDGLVIRRSAHLRRCEALPRPHAINWRPT